MKNIIKLIFPFLIMSFLFLSCDTEHQNEITQSKINILTQHTVIKEYDNFFIEKTVINDEKTVVRVFDYFGNQLGDDYNSFEELDIYWQKNLMSSEEFYYVGIITKGTRINCDIYSADKYFSKVEEVPNTEYRIHNKFGVPITDIYFEDYVFSEKGTIGNEGFDALFGCIGGNRYCYEIKNGEFILKYIDYAGEIGEEYFGLKKIQYYYTVWQKGLGLIDSENNVIIEPIHSRIDVPMKDRLIIYTGYQAHNSYPDEQMAHITDFSGNIFASYSYINCFTFDEGDVWIAYYCGDERHTMERYNKSKGYLGEGYWFIDKNGNILSERFNNLDFYSIDSKKYKSYPENVDDIVVGVVESGETVTFSVGKYICK